jgi:hypothetical protein
MRADFNKFPPWDERGALDPEALKAELTRSNASELLKKLVCPGCGVVGEFRLFNKHANNAVGIECSACGKKHPFMAWGIQWVPVDKKEKRRSNDIVAVTQECGDFCYLCGLAKAELKQLGFSLQVHHAQQHAVHGENGKKIPLCSACHFLGSALQHNHRRTLAVINGSIDEETYEHADHG